VLGVLLEDGIKLAGLLGVGRLFYFLFGISVYIFK